MSASSIISILGISILLVYGLTRILEFYGIGINVYGSYISFYFFILISSFVLPRDYYKLKIIT
jgi:branched-subunit amino acid ABC-type transport system permease component